MLLGQTAMANLVSILKSRDTTLPIPLCKKPMVFPVAIYMAMWELDHKKRWALKNWLFQIVVLGKTLESPLESKEIKPIILKGNQSWIFIGRTDAEAEAPVFWSFYANRRLIGKVPDAGKYWGQKEKRVSEDEMAGWHHQWNGHETGQSLGDSEEQESQRNKQRVKRCS